MHLPQYHPSHKLPEINSQDLMNLLLIIIGVMVTLLLFPWRNS